MVVSMRSFILVCQELGIENAEYSNIVSKKIHGFSIEEWVNFNTEDFIKYQSQLSRHEKIELWDYLLRCQEVLDFDPR